MLDFIWQSILYLNEPIHVANIQKFFGLERIEPAKNSAQHQHTPNNVNIFFLHNVIAAITSLLFRPLQPVESSTSSSDGESSESDSEAKDYVIHNYYWYWLFKFGTTLGDEIFYASVVPFWFWNIDGAVGRRIINVWALSMFIGNCLTYSVRLCKSIPATC